MKLLNRKYLILRAQNNIDLANTGELFLKLEANGNNYSFLYRYSPDVWLPLLENVDARFLSTETAGFLVGVIYGSYCTSLGHITHNSAIYNRVEYKGNNDIYH